MVPTGLSKRQGIVIILCFSLFATSCDTSELDLLNCSRKNDCWFRTGGWRIREPRSLPHLRTVEAIVELAMSKCQQSDDIDSVLAPSCNTSPDHERNALKMLKFSADSKLEHHVLFLFLRGGSAHANHKRSRQWR
jgi:hypothetical protein